MVQRSGLGRQLGYHRKMMDELKRIDKHNLTESSKAAMRVSKTEVIGRKKAVGREKGTAQIGLPPMSAPEAAPEHSSE